MTANPHSIDLSAIVAQHLEQAEPDVLRSMLASFMQALMGAEADARVRRRLRHPQSGADQLPQRLPGP